VAAEQVLDPRAVRQAFTAAPESRRGRVAKGAGRREMRPGIGQPPRCPRGGRERARVGRRDGAVTARGELSHHRDSHASPSARSLAGSHSRVGWIARLVQTLAPP
jgi:hypothetical protein